MIRTAGIVLFLSCAPLTALAAQMTVGDLEQICNGGSKDAQSACRFYILGVTDGASFGTGLETAAGPLCIASETSDKALVEAVKEAMRLDLAEYPEDRSLTAAGFVAAAAMRAFPCQGSN